MFIPISSRTSFRILSLSTSSPSPSSSPSIASSTASDIISSFMSMVEDSRSKSFMIFWICGGERRVGSRWFGRVKDERSRGDPRQSRHCWGTCGEALHRG